MFFFEKGDIGSHSTLRMSAEHARETVRETTHEDVQTRPCVNQSANEEPNNVSVQSNDEESESDEDTAPDWTELFNRPLPTNSITQPVAEPPVVKRKRGRPLGSKNKPKLAISPIMRSQRERKIQTPEPKKKRGRPLGSKNKPKPPRDHSSSEEEPVSKRSRLRQRNYSLPDSPFKETDQLSTPGQVGIANVFESLASSVSELINRSEVRIKGQFNEYNNKNQEQLRSSLDLVHSSQSLVKALQDQVNDLQEQLHHYDNKLLAAQKDLRDLQEKNGHLISQLKRYQN